jgi:hypothetical protein
VRETRESNRGGKHGHEHDHIDREIDRLFVLDFELLLSRLLVGLSFSVKTVLHAVGVFGRGLFFFVALLVVALFV